MKIEFSKYEGAGNDFVVIDNRDGSFLASDNLVAALCDRRFGIGADGLLLLEDDPGCSSFRMRYFNSDGPEASMCGNGGRCISLFAAQAGITDHKMSFSAVDGMHSAKIISAGENDGVVSLQMCDTSTVETVTDGYFINTGSPHYVEFVDDVDDVDVFAVGRRLRQMPEFISRGGSNYNFVQILRDGVIKIRTYERGVENETLACGTGSVASAIIASITHFPALHSVEVYAVGGKLGVSFIPAGGMFRDVWLTGPARRVFSGVFDIDNFYGSM